MLIPFIDIEIPGLPRENNILKVHPIETNVPPSLIIPIILQHRLPLRGLDIVILLISNHERQVNLSHGHESALPQAQQDGRVDRA
jgi:hypothetical protein